MKSLSKNPDDRPQTAEQFRAELLAIDKERRASVPRSRAVSGNGPALASPRKQTPIDQQETRVSGPPSPWAAKEDTVRAPQNFANPDTTSHVQPTSVTAGPEKTANDPRPAGKKTAWGPVVLVAVGAVVLAAIAVVAWQMLSHQTAPVPYVKPANAPVVAEDTKLWDLELPAERRNAKDADRAMAEGDALWHDLKPDQSLTRYLVAWQADPRPELALKIGEIYFQKNKLEEARHWWARVRKDDPGSSAISYLDAVMPLQ